MTRAWAAAFAASCALSACARPEAPVKLAVIAPMSGELAADGQGMQRAVTLAVEDARADGTLSRPVEVLALDDRADPAAAAAAAGQAAADPAVFAV
ncbi:MAG: ABC transporter substrate-binding protein, partial [Elusimicrobiota bacterium]